MSDLTGFTERLLAVLDSGRKTSTYKYALILALVDSVASHSTSAGRAPKSVSAGDLAPRVIDLYWQQTRPWPELDEPLRQNNRGQAEIVRRISEFREKVGALGRAPFGFVSNTNPSEADRLVADVRWKLIQMPVPRLQRSDGSDEPFIYRITWDEHVGRREAESGTFDDRLTLVKGAGDHLLTMAPLIRPLVQRSWALDVGKLNHLKVDELEQHLFDSRRLSLQRVQHDLKSLQSGRCFYCRKPVTDGGQIDHFIPWTRHFDNSIQNLVFAHSKCNNNKRALLASSRHLSRWLKRLDQSRNLAEIAKQRSWESRPDESLALARANYLRLPDGTPLWDRRGTPPAMKPAEESELKSLFAAMS